MRQSFVALALFGLVAACSSASEPPPGDDHESVGTSREALARCRRPEIVCCQNWGPGGSVVCYCAVEGDCN
jgi:predicted MFS family arabinose efflux permease